MKCDECENELSEEEIEDDEVLCRSCISDLEAHMCWERDNFDS